MAERNPEHCNLILFDGDCGFCTGAVRFIARFDSRKAFRCVPLDRAGDLPSMAGTNIEANGFGSLLVVPAHTASDSAPLQKAAAVLFIVRRLDWPWRLLRVIRLLPSPLLDWIYDQIARHRYLLSGRPGACPLPTAPGRDIR